MDADIVTECELCREPSDDLRMCLIIDQAEALCCPECRKDIPEDRQGLSEYFLRQVSHGR